MFDIFPSQKSRQPVSQQVIRHRLVVDHYSANWFHCQPAIVHAAGWPSCSQRQVLKLSLSAARPTAVNVLLRARLTVAIGQNSRRPTDFTT